MKHFFTIILAGCLVFLGSYAQADESILPKGEFKLRSYSLTNGSPSNSYDLTTAKTDSFSSLYISPAAMETILGEERDLYNLGLRGINSENLKGFAVKVAYAPTSDITLHTSFGFTETIDQKQANYSNSIGWEVDLGVAYKFLNNFAYEIHFGYMDTGDLFKESTQYMDVEEITIVTNKLTMSF
ncbi:MAG TPA: hypothetical protein EYP35_07785 [Desulfobacterales bacterium]|nr:hypothetical protein [Desulfobacterales bacterium]HIP40406.1 hypothetical protein [Desulfocapsa sulfexigens]